MEYHKLQIMGAIHIKADRSLAETAKVVGVALENLILVEDPPGTFDEFPSFSGKSAGLSFVLLGIPDLRDQIGDEPIIDYTLQISLVAPSKLATEPCDASVFLRS